MLYAYPEGHHLATISKFIERCPICTLTHSFGVVKAFLEADLLPRVITGTSAGGLVAALVCTRTDSELKELLKPELADKITACSDPFTTWVRRWWRTGARFSTIEWARKVCCFFGASDYGSPIVYVFHPRISDFPRGV